MKERVMEIKRISVPGYEEVVEFTLDTDLKGFIAIHSTKLGPAFGGIRLRQYASEDQALQDVLNLSKAMSYKAAAAHIALGGGKGVVIADPNMPSSQKQKLLLSLADVLNALQGRFIAAGDMGLDPTDMSVIATKTPFVAGTKGKNSSGDPSPFTAYGVFQGMRAMAKVLWGTPVLKGKTIAIQGVGKVSLHLIERLFWEGAHLIIGTRDPNGAAALSHKYQAQIVSSEEILGIRCDILAPCAIGGVISPKTLPQLRCKGIAGAANNQLSHPEMALELQEKGILYAPDFVINAGGMINIGEEIGKEHYQAALARNKTENIYEILLKILEIALAESRTTTQIAEDLAIEALSR